MNKPISKNVHGLIDYGYALIVPLLPEIVGFKKQKAPNRLCRSLGAGALSYTLLTKASWGLVPLIPFKKHLIMDFSVSCFALATPWLFGFSKKKKAVAALMITGLLGL